MLIRATWSVAVAEPVTLPRSHHLELSKLLHEQLELPLGSEAIPSTTFSGLVGMTKASGDFITFHPDEPYHLSLCGLQTESSKVIKDLDLSELDFLGAQFLMGDRQDTITSYETLYQTLVADEPEPTRRFECQFQTPTAFSQARIYLPLPIPHLMARSWLERWNEFAPVYLGGDELVSYLSEAIAISRHRIQTRSFPIHHGRVTGFTGEVTLQVLNRADLLLANVANLLIQYSQFAGTGMKTRLGMGQTSFCQEQEYK